MDARLRGHDGGIRFFIEVLYAGSKFFLDTNDRRHLVDIQRILKSFGNRGPAWGCPGFLRTKMTFSNSLLEESSVKKKHIIQGKFDASIAFQLSIMAETTLK